MRLIAKIFAILMLLAGGLHYYNSSKPESYPDSSSYHVTVTGYQPQDRYDFVIPKSYIFFPAHKLENEILMLRLRLRPDAIASDKESRWRQDNEEMSPEEKLSDILSNFAEVRIHVGGEFSTYQKQQNVFPDELRDQTQLEKIYELSFLGYDENTIENTLNGQAIGRYWWVNDGKVIEAHDDLFEYYLSADPAKGKGFFIRCVMRQIRPNGMCSLNKDLLQNLRMEIVFHSQNLSRWREFDQRITEFVLSHIIHSAEPE